MIILDSRIGFDSYWIWNFALGNSVKIQESQVWKIETFGCVSQLGRRQTTVTDHGEVGGHGGVGHAQGGLGHLHRGGGEAGAGPLSAGYRRGDGRGGSKALFAQTGRGSMERSRRGVRDVAGHLREVGVTVRKVNGDVNTVVLVVIYNYLVINSFDIIIINPTRNNLVGDLMLIVVLHDSIRNSIQFQTSKTSRTLCQGAVGGGLP